MNNMPKELRVGVVGIPIKYNPNKESFFTEKFKPKATDKIRKRVIKHLNTFKKRLEEHGLKLVINDCGELIAGWNKSDPEVYRSDILQASRELKKLDNKHDLLIVLGLRHTPAYTLYKFSGKVIRVDFHGDAINRNESSITYANYFHHAMVKDRLKPLKDVACFGLGSEAHEGQGMVYEEVHPKMKKYLKKQVNRKELNKTIASTFDIDLAGLDLKYRTTANHLLSDEIIDDRKTSSSGVKISDLGRTIIRNKTKRIGIFEYTPSGNKEKHMERAIKALSVAGLISAANHKLNKKIQPKTLSEGKRL
jgi:hypothetical protein